MAQLRTILTFAVVGTLLGILGGTLLAPTVVKAELCGLSKDVENRSPCATTVESAAAGVIRYQLYGAAGGTLLGVVAGLGWGMRKKKPADAPKA